MTEVSHTACRCRRPAGAPHVARSRRSGAAPSTPGRPGPAYLVEERAGPGARSRGGGRRRRLRARERPARPRRPPRRRVRNPRPQRARVVAVRLRARHDRRDLGADLRLELAARLRSTSRATRSRSARSSRTTSSARSSTGFEGRVLSYADLDEPARARPRLRRRAPRRVRRGRRCGRRGRPLHLHLHLRHDGPAEGLHDPPPQLRRDGREGRRDARDRRPGRRDAAVASARPQLRPPDAPGRRAPGLHDRVPRRPAARGRGAAGDPADGDAERAAPVREDPHDPGRGLRHDRRRSGCVDPLGCPGRPPLERVRPGGAARAPVARAPARARRPCSSTGRSSAGSASTGSGTRTPAARRSRARSPSSSTRSGSSSSRGTASPSARPRRRSTSATPSGSARSAGRCPASSCGSPRTARS